MIFQSIALVFVIALVVILSNFERYLTLAEKWFEKMELEIKND